MPSAISPEVLVTGATGVVGSAVVRRLAREGITVRGFAKDPPPQDFRPGVETLVGDVADLEAVRAAMTGCRQVVHLAGLVHVTGQREALDGEFARVNVRGTENVVSAAVAAGADRLVFASTVAVYGDTEGGIADEETRVRPDSEYARSKVLAESAALGATSRTGAALSTVLRLGSVYGPQMKGNYVTLAKALSARRYLQIGRGTNRRTLIYEEDVADAILAVLSTPGTRGGVFNVSDGAVHTVKEIVAAMCGALGRGSPRFVVPARAAFLGAALLDMFGRLAGRRQGSYRAALGKLTEDVAVSAVRFQKETGFRARFDLASGWRLTVDGLRQRGILPNARPQRRGLGRRTRR